MAHSDYMAMKYAFKEQFGYYMIESGHDALSVQFFRGWTKAEQIAIALVNGVSHV